MGLFKLFGWSSKKMDADACGTACGASEKPEEKPAACGAGDKPASCGTACGAGEK